MENKSGKVKVKTSRIKMIKLLVLILLVGTLSHAQITSYKAKHCFYVRDVQGEPITEKPLGSNVTIKFDTFFKSYDITYIDEKGQLIKLTFSYQFEDPQYKLPLYKDVKDHACFIVNKMSEDKTLFVIYKEIPDWRLEIRDK